MPWYTTSHTADQVKRERSEARFDIRTLVTGVIVPITVGILATRVDDYRAWLLVGMGVVAVIASAVPHLTQRYMRWLARRSDTRLARKYYPRVQVLFARFGEFTASDRSGNLHFVLSSDLRSPPPGVVEALSIGDQHTFNSWWHTVNIRVQSARPTVDELVRSLGDLAALANAYKQCCFDPVFARPTTAFREALDPRACAELEAVREQFNSYLTQVQETIDQLGTDVRSVPPPRHWLQRPKPLLR
jgi:hypothetical protein